MSRSATTSPAVPAWRKALVAVLVVLIVGAHVALWQSDMEPGLTLAFTLLNALAWTVVLAPLLLVDRWLAAIRRRNATSDTPETTR